jgi:hypothetical protein
MTPIRRAVTVLHAGLLGLCPREFRRRHGDEMRLDFADDLRACATAVELGTAACRAYVDLLVSAAREWWGSEGASLVVYAVLAHGLVWLLALAVAKWEWPGGPHLYPLVLEFGVLSVLGIAITLWRQRRSLHSRAYCSLSVAELD